MFGTVPGTLLTELDNVKTEVLAMGRVRILVDWHCCCFLKLSPTKEAQNLCPTALELQDPTVAQQKRIHLQCRRSGFDPRAGNIPWRRKWQLIPVLLPGKSYGQRSLVGYSSQGHKRVGYN